MSSSSAGDPKCNQLVPGTFDDQRVGVQVVRQSGARLVDRRSSAAGERRVVDVEGGEEGTSGLVGEQGRPHDLDVDGGVAYARRTPVDETGQAAVADQAVPLEVAMDPGRSPVVRRCGERLVPAGDGGLGVDQVARRSMDRFTSRLVVFVQWPRPVPRRWCPVSRQLLDRPDEFREIRARR